jgi:hypothetical protein
VAPKGPNSGLGSVVDPANRPLAMVWTGLYYCSDTGIDARVARVPPMTAGKVIRPFEQVLRTYQSQPHPSNPTQEVPVYPGSE